MTDHQLKTLDMFSMRIISASDALYDAQHRLLRVKATSDSKDSNFAALSSAKQFLKAEITLFDDFAKTIIEPDENLSVVTRYVDSIRHHVL